MTYALIFIYTFHNLAGMFLIHSNTKKAEALTECLAKMPQSIRVSIVAFFAILNGMRRRYVNIAISCLTTPCGFHQAKHVTLLM
jgi:hypothetical protein